MECVGVDSAARVCVWGEEDGWMEKIDERLDRQNSEAFDERV